MIENLLKEENCVIVDRVQDWKDAVHVSLERLIEQGYCTEEYEKAVFDSTAEFGPYYVLTDNMALIHATNKVGVSKTQMAVTVLREPVQFEEDGADVQILHLRKENGYLPDLDELRRLAVPGTKLICINNPNNPTGALMSTEILKEIVTIARSVDAYVLCDEVYRHLTQEDAWSESIADLYEKGISVGSMSKVFSLAGLRLGWIATHDQAAMRQFLSHRDYNHISCGLLDEAIASLALEHCDEILRRNRRIVRENLAVLDAWVQSEARISYCRPQAGTTALISYDYDIPSYDFCRRMFEETGAFVTPGDCFEQPKSFRTGYACDIQTLKSGLAAVSSFLRTLEEERK